MKKMILFCLTVCCTTGMFAQGGLLLDNNVRLTCNGDVNLVIENGKWKNTGGVVTFGASKIKFKGDTSAPNSTIEGDNTVFWSVEIDKSQNNLKLVSVTTTVLDNFVFTNKNLDLNGQTLFLGSTNAVLIGENENSRSYSAMPASRITKTQSLFNPSGLHFGNMGIRFTAFGNLGNTTVDRRHKVQTLPSGNSIQKYWRVSAVNPAGLNATLRFNYFDAELNGLNEGALTIWRSIDNGVSWTDMGVASSSIVSNYAEQIAIADISGWWTLGEVSPFGGHADERSEIPNEPESQQYKWSISPNPVTAFATVSITSGEAKTVRVECFRMDGKIALSDRRSLEIGENRFPLDLQTLSPGVYFVRISDRPFQAIRVVKTAF